MSFYLCLEVFILSFVIVDGVNAFEGDLNGTKIEFSLKNMKKILPTFNPDEFDCVDIDKQPAFDHPVLTNHKIQLEPTFLKVSKQLVSESNCPPGKVPVAKDRASDVANPQAVDGDHYGQHLAAVESGQGYTLHGVRSLIELHNPRPIKTLQFSMATVWVLAGPKSEFNSLQAGWGVHPLLYKDDNTHLTIYWTVDNYVKTGCYNTRCSGFVQTHNSFYPGQSFPKDAVDDKNHNVLDVAIVQEVETGNWWLTLNGNIGIGYWPKEILTHLAEKATQVRYGGWAFNFPSDSGPPMGNGNFPTKDIQKSSFFAKLRVFDSSYSLARSSTLSMSTMINAPSCYSALYLANQGKHYGDLFTYGGPGGASCGV